jgi:hypothetical protein
MPLSILIADLPLPKTPPSAAEFLASPLLAFLLTVAIEWPLLAWWSGLGLRKTAAFALLVNGLTWGLAMGALAVWSLPVPVVEAAVAAAEAALLMLLWHWSWRRAVPVSLGMNLASWLGGSALLGFSLRHA